MHYSYHAPIAERHEVDWYKREHPGIYDTQPRQFFQSLKLCAELVTWLNDHAPGWRFHSDWDYGNSGDDDEGCHLTVPTREAGEAFVVKATEMSKEWQAADRERMALRIYHVSMDGEVEIARAHEPQNLRYQIERDLRVKFGLEPRYAMNADCDVVMALTQMLTTNETERTISLRLRPGEPVSDKAMKQHLRVKIVRNSPKDPK